MKRISLFLSKLPYQLVLPSRHTNTHASPTNSFIHISAPPPTNPLTKPRLASPRLDLRLCGYASNITHNSQPTTNLSQPQPTKQSAGAPGRSIRIALKSSTSLTSSSILHIHQKIKTKKKPTKKQKPDINYIPFPSLPKNSSFLSQGQWTHVLPLSISPPSN